MKLIQAYTRMSLVLRIVIGLVIGVILALLAPKATWIGLFGTIFVGALKAIAPVLVLVLVSSSLAQSREKLGSQFVTIVILYLLSTFLAAVVAVAAVTSGATFSAVSAAAAVSTGHCDRAAVDGYITGNT